MSLVTVNREELLLELKISQLPEDQKERIWQLIFDIFQTRILDFILSQLEEENKEIFLKTLVENEDQAEIFVRDKIPEVEVKITQLVDEVKKELLEDVRKTKGK